MCQYWMIFHIKGNFIEMKMFHTLCLIKSIFTAKNQVMSHLKNSLNRSSKDSEIQQSERVAKKAKYLPSHNLPTVSLCKVKMRILLWKSLCIKLIECI